MSLVDEFARISEHRHDHTFATWGEVTQTSPLKVKLAGDTASINIQKYNTNYTPTLNDIVVLFQIGSQWVIVCDI